MSIAGFLPIYWLGVVAATYIFTQLWHWSRGSLFVAIWFHGMINFSGGYAFSRDYWTVADYADWQLGALQTLTYVTTAVIVAIIARTDFARSLTAAPGG